MLKKNIIIIEVPARTVIKLYLFRLRRRGNCHPLKAIATILSEAADKIRVSLTDTGDLATTSLQLWLAHSLTH